VCHRRGARAGIRINAYTLLCWVATTITLLRHSADRYARHPERLGVNGAVGLDTRIAYPKVVVVTKRCRLRHTL